MNFPVFSQLAGNFGFSRDGFGSRLPPPAKNQVRTSLVREFAFLGREVAVFRGCPGRDDRTGSAETRRRGNTGRKAVISLSGPIPMKATFLVIAHNAAFDRPFLERRLPIFAEKHWACSRFDVDWKASGIG